MAAGNGGGSADAAAALRLLAGLNELSLDDSRIMEVALQTGADVPVCVASRACDMTGAGEGLLPLDLLEMPAVLVNPRVPAGTRRCLQCASACAMANFDRCHRCGDASAILVGSRPRDERLDRGSSSAAPTISKSSRRASSSSSAACWPRCARPTTFVWSGMIGLRRDLLCDLRLDADAQAAGEKLRADHPGWWVHAGTLS